MPAHGIEIVLQQKFIDLCAVVFAMTIAECLLKLLQEIYSFLSSSNCQNI